MSGLSILLTRQWPEEALAAIAGRHTLVMNPDDRAPSRAELMAAFETFDVICPTITDRIDGTMVPARPRTRAICGIGAGIEHIDLAACRAAGILISNTPDVTTEETADLAILLAMMCARRAGEGERLLRAGGWTGWAPMQLLGQRLRGKMLGLVGFGRIGQAMATRARALFDMRIAYTARHPSPAAAQFAAEYMPLDRLLAEADVVSLHVPGGDATRCLIDEGRLALMKRSAILVNTARGEIVDEEALIAALSQRRIAAAGLDVYHNEPQVPAALRQLENIVLLPHLGSATRETRAAMALRAFANVDAVAVGEPLPDLVLP